MILKIKAFIYRQTGIYLAYKEESDYVGSKEFWNEFNKFSHYNQYEGEEERLSPECIYGLVVGMWQGKHGFVRSFKW